MNAAVILLAILGSGPFGQKVSELAHERNELRKSAATASVAFEVDLSLQDGENSLSLVYRAAIQNVNEALEPALGPDTITATTGSDTETTPEATADRVFSQVSATFDAYLTQAQTDDPELSTEQAFSDFVALIRTGIENGFAEARTILSNLGALDETVSADVDATYELLLQKLNEYEANGAVTAPAPAEEEPAATA